MFTYPCVQGGMLEMSNGSASKFLGWTLSHATGCFFSGQNYVDIWLHRNIRTNDNKGIYE